MWYLLLALAIPSILQASTVALLLVFLVLVFYRTGFITAWKHTTIAWVLIALACLIGLISSEMPGKSVTGLYNAIRAFAVFFAVFAVTTRVSSRLLLKTATLVNIAAAFGIFVVFISVSIAGDAFLFRQNAYLIQHIGNLHEFANLAAVNLLLLGCLFYIQPEKKYWLIIPVILLITVLLFSTSKGNWISLLICLCYLATAYMKRALWYSLLALFLLAYFYIFLFCDQDCYLPIALESTIRDRQDIYANTLALIAEQPWTGHGINTFKYASGMTDPTGEADIMPHNIYLEQLYGWGITGTVLFFCGLGMLTRSIKIIRPAGSETSDFFYLSGNTLLIYSLTRGLLDMKFFSFHYLALLTFAAALVFSAHYVSAETDRIR